MRGSLSLGTIFGIPIRLHASWFLVAALVTWTLAIGYFPQQIPGSSPATYWAVGGLAALLFFASVLIHELAHSVLALREQVPVKSITLFIFGGVAQIGREPPTAGAEFRIAIAGPLSSLGLAALFGGLGTALAGSPVIAAPLLYLAQINLLLALFNMIPGFPLDGGRVLRAAIWGFRGDYRNATRWAVRAGRTVAFGLIGLGVAQILLTGGFANGLWLAFIGWYLNGAAGASLQQLQLKDMLAGVKARSVATQACVPVPGELPLDQLVEDHVLAGGQRCFYVTGQDRAEGLITLKNLRAVARGPRSTLTAGEVMTRLVGSSVDADAEVWDVLQRMDEAEADEIPVVENGSFLGLITREGLMNHIRLRAELAA
jgi:Zn-dependent protease/CBS domain-containing protein